MLFPSKLYFLFFFSVLLSLADVFFLFIFLFYILLLLILPPPLSLDRGIQAPAPRESAHPQLLAGIGSPAPELFSGGLGIFQRRTPPLCIGKHCLHDTELDKGQQRVQYTPPAKGFASANK